MGLGLNGVKLHCIPIHWSGCHLHYYYYYYYYPDNSIYYNHCVLTIAMHTLASDPAHSSESPGPCLCSSTHDKQYGPIGQYLGFPRHSPGNVVPAIPGKLGIVWECPFQLSLLVLGPWWRGEEEGGRRRRGELGRTGVRACRNVSKTTIGTLNILTLGRG